MQSLGTIDTDLNIPLVQILECIFTTAITCAILVGRILLILFSADRLIKEDLTRSTDVQR